MSTSKQDREFENEIKNYLEVNVSNLALDATISWIAQNLDPIDVFDEDDLIEWAESNGYTKE